MTEPTVALVHDNFTGPMGMGKVVELHARWLLDEGWPLTVVGGDVPAWLIERNATHVRLVGKPHGLPSLAEHLVWCARAARVLRGVEADVIHVHAPLLAPLGNLLTTHFMERPAYVREVREQSRGLEGLLRHAQANLSRWIDDIAYRRLAGRTFVSFVSEFLRDEFRLHYGNPLGGWVLPPPAPAWRPVGDEEREAARRRWDAAAGRIVVGYVGGSDPRKGFFHLEPIANSPDLQLLVAGPGSERMRLGGAAGLGFIDIDELYAACDVVVAPAAFDSAPVAVLQAIARGVPVVTSRFSGWASALTRLEAGVVWDGREPLEAAIRRATEIPLEACRRFTEEFSEGRQRDALLSVYRHVARLSGS